MDISRFSTEAAALGLSLSREQLQAFAEFEEKLYEANERTNFTRVAREAAWVRHFLDSLLFQDMVPVRSTVLDIGTGPGFPAWPLACARPDLQVTAIDSNGKMLGFLGENHLPNLVVVQVRAEEWDRREAFDVVTGRALAPLPAQLEVSAPFCRVGGVVLPMRTLSDQIEDRYGMLGLELERVEQRELPDGYGQRVAPVFRKRRRTPKSFPRRWSEIKNKPLA